MPTSATSRPPPCVCICLSTWVPRGDPGLRAPPHPISEQGLYSPVNRPRTVKEFQNSNGGLRVRLSGGCLHTTPAGPEASGHAPAFFLLVVFAKLCSGLMAGEPQGRPSLQSSRGRISPVATGEQWSPSCPQGSPSPRPGPDISFLGKAGPRCYWSPSPGSSVTTLLGTFGRILPPGNPGHPQTLAGP